MKPRRFLRPVLVAAALTLLLPGHGLNAQEGASGPHVLPSHPRALVARLQQDVLQLRGLEFKRPVPVEMQTPEELRAYIDKQTDEEVPPEKARNLGKIVKRLGLHPGPEIEDLRMTMRGVLGSQVAAYYDTDNERIFIIAEGGDEIERGGVYLHELYHALQDQYFNLEDYLSDKRGLDEDQALARVAVVEGEATFAQTHWMVSRLFDGKPPPGVVAQGLRMQAEAPLSGPEVMADGEAIPPFILEILVGNYVRGAAFISALQEKGWDQVEKLYREYPPVSTEQILHPHKWFEREGASRISWPRLKGQRVLRQWELIEDEVLGEVQLRTIFNVNGMRDVAAAAADGWDGDRYAVFRRKGGDDTLLLLRLSWDNEGEATQFVEAYRRLLPVKYADGDEAVSVQQSGSDVFIVEGGSAEDHPALMKIVRDAKKRPPARPKKS